MKQSSFHNLTLAYLQHQNELRQFVQRQVACRDTAADLLQDVYLRVAVFDTKEIIVNQRAFLYRVTGNLLLDYFRAQTRHAQRDGGPLSEDLVCPHPEPDQVLDGQQRLQAFGQRLRQLPPPMREVFSLGRLVGRSHQQIAAELAIPPRRVEHLMHQAIKCLQHDLQETLG